MRVLLPRQPRGCEQQTACHPQMDCEDIPALKRNLQKLSPPLHAEHALPRKRTGKSRGIGARHDLGPVHIRPFDAPSGDLRR